MSSTTPWPVDRWSPEQVAQALRREHSTTIAVESIYQALYDPARTLQRDPRDVLRRHRPYRRRRRRADERFGRFISPLHLLDERPAGADDRLTPGHWEGDLVVGSYNRSAIGTLVERSTRFSILVHLEHPSRATGLREQLIRIFNQMPPHLRRSLTWDQGTEMCHHQQIADATEMPVFFCRAGRPWERASNENTYGLLRDYFPKGTNLRVYTARDLEDVADETQPTAPQDARLAHTQRALHYAPRRRRVATMTGIRRPQVGTFTWPRTRATVRVPSIPWWTRQQEVSFRRRYGSVSAGR